MSPGLVPSPEDRDPRARLPRGRHRLPRDYVIQNQDDRLFAATIARIGLHGYDETTVAHIVTAARLSRRTFYQRYPNKAACFLATHALIASHLEEAAERATAQDPDWPERPAAAIEAALAIFAANPDLARFLLAAPPRADAPEPVEAHRRFLACAASRLCDGAPSGLRISPQLATALVAGLASLVVDAVEADGGEGFRSLGPHLSDLFVHGLERVGRR